MTVSFRPPARRWATALLAVVIAAATMAAPASAAHATTSTTTPTVTTTTVSGPTTTTTKPVTTTSTTAAPPTTVPGPPPTTAPAGPPTTLVSATDLAALLNGLNADLAKLSAIQAFAQAKAAAATGPAKPVSAAVGAPGLTPAVASAAPDPAMVGAAAEELKANAVRNSAESDVASSRRRLHELAVAYYVHADAAGAAGVVDPATGTRADRSVMLALLLSQERHNYDGGRRALADAKKAQSGAKAHADQLVAARGAAIEAAARKAALDATTTTTSTTTITVPGAPTSAPAPTTRGVPGYRTSGLTILGPAVLSGDELKGWYGSTGHQPSLTVPLATLTALYQTTGVTYGVRDDVAFSQAIIETGYFGFPAGGQVATADNNFAGIGACDSCHNGNGFPSAASGVAAQLQLLHNYASPMPLPGPLGLSVGPTGCCPTWMSLTGVWATASFYGYAILTLYKHMLDWALPRRASGAGL